MKPIIISLGGSLIVPEEIDIEFLKKFKQLILKHVKKGKRFAIITGGGKICRKYQKAAADISDLNSWDSDYLGIHVTRLNAHLMRTIFKKYSHPQVIKNPRKKINFTKKILIGAGWKPGCSTDYDAVLLAEKLKANIIINLTNVEYVYDRDPKYHKNATKIEKISWRDFRKIVGNKWNPGLNAPFDPVASKKAQELKLKVIITASSLKNLDNIFNGKRFKGTVIE